MKSVKKTLRKYRHAVNRANDTSTHATYRAKYSTLKLLLAAKFSEEERKQTYTPISTY